MPTTAVERVLREGAAALPMVVVDVEAVRPLLAERLEGEDAMHELDSAELGDLVPLVASQLELSPERILSSRPA